MIQNKRRKTKVVHLVGGAAFPLQKACHLQALLAFLKRLAQIDQRFSLGKNRLAIDKGLLKGFFHPLLRS